MNERIKELLIKSQLLEAIGENAYEEDGWEPIVEKFADLIIGECAGIYSKIDNGNLHLGTDDYLTALVKHFEVNK